MIGHPYGGFLTAKRAPTSSLRNCVIDGRKTYQKIGAAGKPVAMGTYGYRADLVVDFRMIHCRMGNDIHDRSRWGVVATNFMKNILIEDCVLSRVDVHMGVSGDYIIRRSTLGHAGLNAIGRGRLIVEDSTLHGGHLVRFRDDYGSTWEGEVLIRNSRWIPPAGKNFQPVMFGMGNDGLHDFGYPCFMPRLIRIDGLSVDDSKHSKGSPWDHLLQRSHRLFTRQASVSLSPHGETGGDGSQDHQRVASPRQRQSRGDKGHHPRFKSRASIRHGPERRKQ